MPMVFVPRRDGDPQAGLPQRRGWSQTKGNDMSKLIIEVDEPLDSRSWYDGLVKAGSWRDRPPML